MHAVIPVIFLGTFALGGRSCHSLVGSDPVLTEKSLGYIDLTRLDSMNVHRELLRGFPYCSLERGMAQQDGPDHMLYEVKLEGESIVFVSMDNDASNEVREVAVQTAGILDQYGVFPSCEVSHLITERPDVKFHADLHSNIYAKVPGSRIGYRLAGPVLPLNDSMMTRADFGLERWQVGGMKVGFLIWSK